MIKNKLSSIPVDLAALVDHLQVGVMRCSLVAEGAILYANMTFLSMFSVNESDLVDMNAVDLFGDKSVYEIFLKTLQNEDLIKDLEAELRCSDSLNTIWCLISAVAVKDDKGSVIAADVTVRDITDQKGRVKELNESRDLFQSIFDNTAAAIMLTDANDKIIAWNSFTERLLGVKRDFLFNKPIDQLYPADAWEKMGWPKIRKRGIKLNIETQIYRRDKSLLDVNLSVSILTDDNGSETGAIAIIQDISRQKQAEDRLKDSENKMRAILDNSPVAITMTDDQENIVSWNKFTEQLLGYDRKDLYMQSVKKLYSEKEWARIRKMDIRKLGGQHHVETCVLTKMGDEIPVSLSINIINDDEGKVVGSVGILQDITNQKETQEMLVQAKMVAEQASESKSMFLANMSHEVRTPMNGIMGMLDLTLETELTHEQKENLNVAKDSAVSLLGLLNDILDLSKVEAGKIKLEEIEFHLPNVAASVIKSMDVVGKDKGLELEVILGDQVPNLVIGDPVRLRQVIINLVNNALKFTTTGKIILDVDFHKETGNDVTLLFSVIDQGIGIPKDRLESVFEIYSQAEASTTRKYGGTGLGLAICRRLVEMMGGRIWVESELEKGSEFKFHAVFKKVDPTKVRNLLDVGSEAGVTSESMAKELEGLKILLTEDNLVNQKIAIKMLEKQGWDVTLAEDGQRALDILENNDFDLILMDVQMPVLGGLETTEIIRKNEVSTGKHIPIIALTGRAMDGDKKECQDAGMDGYVTKPIDRNELFKEIVNLLSKGLTT
ncbi:MAG: PAS domain S-box-containing protein [Candidatus Omnitrophota bacterium]|jgi:PAS domain S-box-containing protein